MATNVTFTSLTADIQNYLERGDGNTDVTVFNQIPRIINSAERKLAQMLKLLGQVEVLTGAPPNGLQQGLCVYPKPDRWRMTVSMNYGTGTTLNARTILLPRSLEYCNTYWPDRTVQDPNQPPLFYSDYDYAHWLVVPTPPQPYPWETINYMQPQLLDQVNQQNFFSQYTPNALLYGCMVEAEVFVKEDQRNQLWTQLWTAELQSLDTQDLQRILDRSAQRRRP